MRAKIKRKDKGREKEGEMQYGCHRLLTTTFQNIQSFEVMFFFVVIRTKALRTLKKLATIKVSSPAESLNSIPIKEVVVSGDREDVNGKLGI